MSKNGRFDYSKSFKATEEKKEEPVVDETLTPVEEPVEKPAEKKRRTRKEYPKGKVCNCQKVRVRQKPSTEAEVIQIIPKGTEVEVIKKVNGWYSVKVNVAEYAYAGYIMEKYVAVNN